MYPAFRVARRLQGLTAIAWSANDLSPHAGITKAEIQKLRRPPGQWVSRKNFLAVCDVYERLSGTPGPTEKCRGWALKMGFYPPLAWEDIDDPNETPSRGVRKDNIIDMTAVHLAMGGFPVRLTEAERDTVIIMLRARGESESKIAATLKITQRHVGRIIAKLRTRESVA